MLHADTSFVDCQGKIMTGEVCPYPYVETTTVDGNFVVRGDSDVGGGAMHVSGPCDEGDCREDGFFSMRLDGGTFDVRSGGNVAIESASSDDPNGKASEIVLQSGSNANEVGGSGGDFFAFAGDGAGGTCTTIFSFGLTFCFHSG